jgi:hypothetical protein
MRVYLDACCLSRLTDDQSQPRVRAEAEAVQRILELARIGAVEWISSVALEAEVAGNPDIESRREMEALLLLANKVQPLDAGIVMGAKLRARRIWRQQAMAPTMRFTSASQKAALWMSC